MKSLKKGVQMPPLRHGSGSQAVGIVQNGPSYLFVHLQVKFDQSLLDTHVPRCWHGLDRHGSTPIVVVVVVVDVVVAKVVVVDVVDVVGNVVVVDVDDVVGKVVVVGIVDGAVGITVVTLFVTADMDMFWDAVVLAVSVEFGQSPQKAGHAIKPRSSWQGSTRSLHSMSRTWSTHVCCSGR